MEEIRSLLRENNQLLKDIRGLLLVMLTDSSYIQQQDEKALLLNVLGDIIAESLEDNTKRNIFSSMVNKA